MRGDWENDFLTKKKEEKEKRSRTQARTKSRNLELALARDRVVDWIKPMCATDPGRARVLFGAVPIGTKRVCSSPLVCFPAKIHILRHWYLATAITVSCILFFGPLVSCNIYINLGERCFCFGLLCATPPFRRLVSFISGVLFRGLG